MSTCHLSNWREAENSRMVVHAGLDKQQGQYTACLNCECLSSSLVTTTEKKLENVLSLMLYLIH
jgi:hypothetical protein